MAEIVAQLNEQLDHANLVNNFRCDEKKDGAYFLKDRVNRTMRSSMHDMDISQKLDFEIEIKPLIDEK